MKPLPAAKFPRLGNRGRKKVKKGTGSHSYGHQSDPDFKMSHAAEFAKTKIMKIYPVMGKYKYSG